MYSTQQVKNNFSRGARTYDAHARMQHSVLQQALSRLLPYFTPGMNFLDAGCGTGYLTHLMDRLESPVSLYGCDMAIGMCRKAVTREANHPYQVACADVQALPYRGNSMDVVLSSLTLQWVNQCEHALIELYRVLKPGGHCLVTTFGPMTLQELRESFETADDKPHVSSFPSIEALQGWAKKAGFTIENAHSEFRCEQYESVMDLMRSIRVIGASNKMETRRRAMTGKGRFQKMEKHYRDNHETERGVPASWEVLYLLLRKDN